MGRQVMIYCERDDCENQVLTARDVKESLPPGWLVVRQGCDGHDDEYDFCSWNCLMVFSASVPPHTGLVYAVVDQELRASDDPDDLIPPDEREV